MDAGRRLTLGTISHHSPCPIFSVCGHGEPSYFLIKNLDALWLGDQSGETLVGRYSGLSIYCQLVSQSYDRGTSGVSGFYYYIEVLHSRDLVCVCVCGENTRMTFVVKHAAASSELPCLHSLKTVFLKAEILISSPTHACMHIHTEVGVVLVSSQTS